MLVEVLRVGTLAAMQHAARALRNLGGAVGQMRCSWASACLPAGLPACCMRAALFVERLPICTHTDHCVPLPPPPCCRRHMQAAGRDVANKLKTAEAGAIPLLVALMAGGAAQGAGAAALSGGAGGGLEDAGGAGGAAAYSDAACRQAAASALR